MNSRRIVPFADFVTFGTADEIGVICYLIRRCGVRASPRRMADLAIPGEPIVQCEYFITLLTLVQKMLFASHCRLYAPTPPSSTVVALPPVRIFTLQDELPG